MAVSLFLGFVGVYFLLHSFVFKQALALAGRTAAAATPGVPVRSGPTTRSSPLLHNDFADTEMPEDSRAQPLSSTQYGDL